MSKSLLVIITLLFTSLVHAECANTIEGLRALVGNADAPLTWKETTDKKPLHLRLSESGGTLKLALSNAEGKWADVTGEVCKKGATSYVAKVASLKWGPSAPSMAKLAKIKEINIGLPYPNQMNVSVMMFKFHFAPN